MYSYEQKWLNSPQFKKLESFIDSVVTIEDPVVWAETLTNKAVELHDEFKEEDERRCYNDRKGIK